MILDLFLFLVPNYDPMALVAKYFWDAKHQVCFGLVRDFPDRVLKTQLTVCGRALSAGAVILSPSPVILIPQSGRRISAVRSG